MLLKITKILSHLLSLNVKDYIAPLLISGVIIFTGGSAWYYSNKADKLITELDALSFQKGQLEVENYQLEQQLQAEKQAVENQQNLAKQLREQADVKTEKVREIFKTTPCANEHLPTAIIEQLH